MRNIHLRYVSEEYDDEGLLKKFEVHAPDSFNFAYDIVDDIAISDPARRALVWTNPEGEEHTFTFADIKKWSDAAASFLQAEGIGYGDRVLVILRRHYQFWIVAPALEKLGAVIVPATFMLKAHDVVYRLKSAEIKAVICTDVGDIADIVDGCIPECPSVKKLFLVNGGGGGLTPKDAAGNFILETENGSVGPALSGESGLFALGAKRSGWIDFNSGVRREMEKGKPFSRIATRVREPMLMYFSSGTAGEPKMVLHAHDYALAHLITAKHWHCVEPDGLHFTISDTGWGKAVWGKLYGQWCMEAAVFVYDFDRFHAPEILGMIGRYQITTFCAPPTMYRMMMGEDIGSFDLSSLHHATTAGEALNPDLFEFWKRETGLTIYEGFGQTEGPLLVGNLRGTTPRQRSMGRPVPLYHIQILREDGSRCDVGERGEICVRADPYPPGLFLEYYKDPEKTAEVIHDGWYHTGDTAWVDENGYFYYVGRIDDVIKSSGYRIGPFEVESVLLEHEAVSECAVTAFPDPLRTSVVKATIVLTPGFSPSEDLTQELQTWVKNRTAPYKYPRIISYVDELPKSISGKIRRVEIREADL